MRRFAPGVVMVALASPVGAVDAGPVPGDAAAARALAATVRIVRVPREEGPPLGGDGHGVLVGPRRVVTALHVVRGTSHRQRGQKRAGAKVVVVASDGSRLKARLVGAWPALDLALLALESPLPGAVDVASPPADGRLLHADRLFGAGRVLARRAVATYGSDRPCLIVVSPGTRPGQSGSGLFDRSGRLVAIVTAGGGPRRGFAVPVAPVLAGGPRVRTGPGTALHPACHAVRHETGRDWRALERVARRWVAREPGDGLAWLALAKAVSARGRAAEAVVLFRDALRRLGDDPAVWVGLGTAHARLGRSGLARWCFLRALRRDPASARLWSNLALTYAEEGRWRDAYRAARRAAERLWASGAWADPLRDWDDLATVWRVYGVTAFETGHHAEAVAAFKQAIPLVDGRDPQDWIGLGWAALEAGDRSCPYGRTLPEDAAAFLESLGEREEAEALRRAMVERGWIRAEGKDGPEAVGAMDDGCLSSGDGS